MFQTASQKGGQSALPPENFLTTIQKIILVLIFLSVLPIMTKLYIRLTFRFINAYD